MPNVVKNYNFFSELILISDYLFLFITLFVCVLLGSYLTTTKIKKELPLGEFFSLIVLYSFVIISLIHINLNGSDLYFYHAKSEASSMFYFIFSHDYFSIQFGNILFLFMLSFFYYFLQCIKIIRFYHPLSYYNFASFVYRDVFYNMFERLFFWFLSLEVQSFCFYVLAAIKQEETSCKRKRIKVFYFRICG